MYDEKFMLRAIDVARECAQFDEVPVGAVLVKDGVILAESGNEKERENNALRHAETIVLEKGAKLLGNWWLENCELYVTLEPCPMCAGAMINSRIRSLYFGAYDEKSGACGSKVNLLEEGLFNHNIEVAGGFLKDECAKLLSDFFKSKREAKRQRS
ncbi:MAG: tRNA adenosine(34) deaminase TadA [Bacteroides sp.]|nr:tRNA adenosine(34) deaminase TadA [Bacillota bacterium]MCM1394101.1 tRNA adenosine(34) deaminase TadA [[Eubacterium] siraeum]MCM1455886.1 tRNA adenosine(34) deaminase TadA [Bacteroides sp.]